MKRSDRLIEQQARLHESRALQEMAPVIALPGPVMQHAAMDWEAAELRYAGPMGVWDAVAIGLEHFVERLEH